MRLITIALFICLACCYISFTQEWEQLPGPFEETIVGLDMNGSHLFINEENNGYYKSIDTGRTWSKMELEKDYSLKIIDSYLFAFKQKDLLRSSDNGTTWKKLKIDTTSISQIFTMNGFLYSYTNNGIWKSTDNGGRWKKTGEALNGRTPYTGSNSLFSMGSGIFRSTDEGRTWSGDLIGLTNKNMTTLSVKGKILITSRELGASYVYYSTSDGVGWDPAGQHYPSIYHFAMNDEYIFTDVGKRLSINGLIHSKVQWEVLKPFPPYIYNGFIRCVDNKIIFVLGRSGYPNIPPRAFAYSTDNGDSWNRIGLPFGKILYLHTDSNTFVAGNKQPDKGLLALSNDYGKTWIEHDSLFTPYLSHDNIHFACGNGIYIKHKDSTKWEKKDNRSFKYAVAAGKNIIGVVDQNKGFLISTDKGESWDSTHSELGTITALHKYNNVLYAGAYSDNYSNNYLLISKDAGISWIKIPVLIDSRTVDSYFKSICIYNKLIFLVLQNGSLVWSSDSGTTWQKNGFLGNSDYAHTIISRDSSIFIATNKFIYRVEDKGRTWIPIKFPSMPINTLHIVNDTLFVGTEGKGIWKYTIPPYIPSNITEKESESAVHYAVYPNPSGEQCTVSVHPLPRKLKGILYNSMGEYIEEIGIATETTHIDTRHLAIGKYTIVFQTNGEFKTVPLTIIR